MLAIGGTAPVIDNVNLNVGKGERIGIAGESGSGKSTLLLAMMGVVKPGLSHLGGSIHFEGQPMLGRGDRELQATRGGRLALIPQNAGTALTPSLRIGQQIDEALRLHTGLTGPERAERTVQLLDRVKLPEPQLMMRRYPHQLSGGQVQRAAIAMALAGNPAALLLDEPTTGLDVTTQLGILDLLSDLGRDSGVAMVCVSHDLGVIARLCGRIAVMYAGGVLEDGPTDVILKKPSHPYTRALLASLPRLSSNRIPSAIPGTPPSPYKLPVGCRFAPRCVHAKDDCNSTPPQFVYPSEGVRLACYYPQTAPVDFESADNADDHQSMVRETSPALTIEALSISYERPRLLRRLMSRPHIKFAVDDVSFEVRKGEVLGLVGESGSGKSTILRAIAGLWAKSSGHIVHDGAHELQDLAGQRHVDRLRAIQLVFQNPDASLNPRHTIEDILAQPLRLYLKLDRAGVRKHAAELLREVRLSETYLTRYPSQLSGGERQRIAIARAFAAEPDVLLCDEVTTALDVSVQAAVLHLLHDLSASRNVATIMVSHDLAVIRAIATRIAVLYRGQLIEIGPASAVCHAPKHPYTKALLAAVLEPDAGAGQQGPKLRDRDDIKSTGCSFAGRCAQRLDACSSVVPAWNGGHHRARCHLL